MSKVTKSKENLQNLKNFKISKSKKLKKNILKMAKNLGGDRQTNRQTDKQTENPLYSSKILFRAPR